MNVLVTGIDGFTGKYMQAELIAHGHTVTGLQADLMDSAAVADEISRVQPEAVIHLAGMSFVAHHDVDQVYQVNILGTRHLLVALAQHVPQVKQVILASTANIYGNNADTVLTEHSSIQPANDYAVSKLAMEHMAHLWSEKLPICIVRPFNYTGVGQSERFLIPKIVAHFKQKKDVISLGNLDVQREFGDVRNVVAIYRKLLEKSVSNVTLNICTGQVHALQDVIALCEQITGHQIKVEVNPAFVRANEIKVLVGSSSLLSQIVEDAPAYDFRDTLRWMLMHP